MHSTYDNRRSNAIPRHADVGLTARRSRAPRRDGVATFLKHGFSLVTPGQFETDTLPELPMLTDWLAKLGGEGTLEVLAPDGNGALSVSVDSEVARTTAGENDGERRRRES